MIQNLLYALGIIAGESTSVSSKGGFSAADIDMKTKF